MMEQALESPPPETRGHWAELKRPPAPPSLQETSPAGGRLESPLEPVTVAVKLIGFAFVSVREAGATVVVEG